MKIELRTRNFIIISQGTVLLANEDDDFTIYFDDERGFQFSLEIRFVTDKAQKQVIKRDIDKEGRQLKWICYNFHEDGTGLTDPLELATTQGKKIYLSFWSRLRGSVAGMKKTREIEYTVYLER